MIQGRVRTKFLVSIIFGLVRGKTYIQKDIGANVRNLPIAAGRVFDFSQNSTNFIQYRRSLILTLQSVVDANDGQQQRPF